MNIFLVSNMYPNDQHPSYGVFVKNTEEILREEGWNIDKAVLYKTNSRFKKLLMYFLYFAKIFIKGLLKNYDVIYVHYAAHNAFPLLFLKKIKKNIKIYTNIHGSDVVPALPSHEKFQPYVKKLLGISTKVITPSNYYKDLVSNKYGIPNSKIFVFPSGGVNKKVFYKMEQTTRLFKELELDDEYNYIGYVSRIDVGKGWETFLKAIAILKKQGFMAGKKAVIVGDGKEYSRFQNTVKDLQLDEVIISYPLLPQEKLGKLFNCLDVFCFPTFRESLGLVGLEAMACGLPVIGSNIGALKDYIKNEENGFLFERGNENDLSDAIVRYFSLSLEEQQHMKEKALETSAQYEVEKIKPLLVNIFRNNSKKDTF